MRTLKTTAALILLAAPLIGCAVRPSPELVSPEIPAPLLEPVTVPDIPPRGATQAQIAVALIEAYQAIWDANGRINAICLIVLGEDRCAAG